LTAVVRVRPLQYCPQVLLAPMFVIDMLDFCCGLHDYESDIGKSYTACLKLANSDTILPCDYFIKIFLFASDDTAAI
jgi:hypothetical protein